MIYDKQMPYTNIMKRRAAEKRYYLKHKQLYIDKNRRRKKELAEFVISLKHHPCADCGLIFPHYVMDFDHLDKRQKISSINRMTSVHMYSKSKILEEIKKCELVCANCHRIRTHKRI